MRHSLFFLVAGAILVLLFLLNVAIGITYGGDSPWYIAMAEGHFSEIIEPYAGRFLHPFLVGQVSQILSLDIFHSFWIISILSLLFFFGIITVFLRDTLRSPLLLIPLFLTPYFFNTLREVFQPDAFYIFLTALFLLALFYRKECFALIVLFLLFLSRESTLLLGVIFIIVSWIRSRRLLAVAALIVVIVALFTSGFIRDLGQPNIHHLSSPVYLAMKLSYNFLTNVFGIIPWANTYDTCVPAFRFSLPASFPAGNIHEVGFCGFDFSLPIHSLITLLSVFGIAPLVLFFVLVKRFRFLLRESAFWVVTALSFGFFLYFLGIPAGTGIERIVGYAWPPFVLLAPLFVSSFFLITKRFVLLLSVLHLLVAWLPFIVQRIAHYTLSSGIFSLFCILLVYFFTFRIINKQGMTKENPLALRDPEGMS